MPHPGLHVKSILLFGRDPQVVAAVVESVLISVIGMLARRQAKNEAMRL